MGEFPVSGRRRVSRQFAGGLLLLACLGSSSLFADEPPGKKSEAGLPVVKMLETKQGVRFVLLGEKGDAPKPLLFCLAMSGVETLQVQPFAASGQEVVRQGWLAVSLDIPGHGAEHRPDEPAGIAAWGVRIQNKEPFVDELAKRVSAVVDYLIQEKYADPARLAIEGTSRGGFLAAHVAAREPRFPCVIMYAPVTDLADVTEFHGLEKNPQLRSLALFRTAEQLADRKIWLIIGNNDERVNTDSAIQFSRHVVQAAKRQKIAPAVTLTVPDTPGHASTADMHHAAVEWLKKRLPASRP